MNERDANAINPNPAAAPSSPENEEDIAEEAANNLCLDCMGPLGRDRYNDVKREVLSAIKRARQQPAQKPQEPWREILEICRQTLDRNPANYNPKSLELDEAYKLVSDFLTANASTQIPCAGQKKEDL